MNQPIKLFHMTTYQFNAVDKLVNNGRPLSQRSHALSNI